MVICSEGMKDMMKLDQEPATRYWLKNAKNDIIYNVFFALGESFTCPDDAQLLDVVTIGQKANKEKTNE